MRPSQLVEQIWLFARDHLPQRLKLKPARLVCPHLLPRRQSAFPHDQRGFARGLRQELRMAATVQRNEPPDCFIHSLSYGQQPVVLQDGRLVIPEGLCDPFALARFIDDAREISKDHVIFEECARVLRDRIERPPERRPRLSVQRMRMRRRDNIRPRVMNA